MLRTLGRNHHIFLIDPRPRSSGISVSETSALRSGHP
jgi:hypothetical protein